MAHFDSVRDAGRGPRFGLWILCSKGVIEVGTNYMPPAFVLPHESWSVPRYKDLKWLAVSSAGLNKPEPIPKELSSPHYGNVEAVKDLIAAVEKGGKPKADISDAARRVGNGRRRVRIAAPWRASSPAVGEPRRPAGIARRACRRATIGKQSFSAPSEEKLVLLSGRSAMLAAGSGRLASILYLRWPGTATTCLFPGREKLAIVARSPRRHSLHPRGDAPWAWDRCCRSQ